MQYLRALWLAWDNWHMFKILPEIIARFDIRSFRRGFIINILNPKAMLFYVTVFPSFIDSGKPVAGQIAALTAAYVVIATIIHGMIAILGDEIGLVFRNPRIFKITRYTFSILLVFIALWFAILTS